MTERLRIKLYLVRQLLGLVAAWVSALPLAAVAQPLLVRHNLYVSADSDTLNYKGEVLALLLEKSKAKYGPYVLQKNMQQGWSQSRAYSRLEHDELDVMATMTSVERENTAIPVRYCLYKGLLGIRVGMGSAESVQALEKVQTLDQLRQASLGAVFDWPDYLIMRDGGLNVLRLGDLPSSFKRLQQGSFQLLPLGIVEVGPIAKRNNLATINSWAIAYPTAYYLFVSKKRPELAERLNYGFEQALKDKSFDQLFERHIGPQLEAMGLDRRKLFFLKNSKLPADTPLDRKALWHPAVFGKWPS